MYNYVIFWFASYPDCNIFFIQLYVLLGAFNCLLFLLRLKICLPKDITHVFSLLPYYLLPRIQFILFPEDIFEANAFCCSIN